jgi:predicted mannosyl-3-phosphoglycerate phosphatase (HAD superfamily)
MKIRQGDIIFSKINEEVSGRQLNKLTIAKGEFTGHNHVLIAEAGSKIYGDKTKFTVKGKAKLVHPEHNTIHFTSGTYIVSFEREYDYLEKTLKAVQD